MEIVQSNSQPREVVISNPKDNASKYIQILAASNVPKEDLQAAVLGVQASMLLITSQEWQANYGDTSTMNADWYLRNYHKKGKTRFVVDHAILEIYETIKSMRSQYDKKGQRTILLVNNTLYDQRTGSSRIFGQATLAGSSAIVTVKKFRDRTSDSETLSKMLQRLVSHELGHTFGMDHCLNVCAMKPSSSVENAFHNTNLQEGKAMYCPSCLTDLNNHRQYGLISF